MPTPESGTHSGAPLKPTVFLMTNPDARVVELDHDLKRNRSSGGSRRLAGAVRRLAITSACLLMGACGGGGGGGGASDGPITTPPPATTEFAWDNGNWDQKEWK